MITIFFIVLREFFPNSSKYTCLYAWSNTKPFETKMSANNSINTRTHRLNKMIVSCSDDLNGGQPLNRETLLDAFDVLYNECNKDAIKKNDRNIFEFTKKCKFFFALFCIKITYKV